MDKELKEAYEEWLRQEEQRKRQEDELNKFIRELMDDEVEDD